VGGRLKPRLAAAIAAGLVVPALMAGPAAAANITVAPDNPEVESCFPFGEGGTMDVPWYPYSAFFYKNVPAFVLKPGDILASFQTVVRNTQTPENPRGDTIVGNFELRFDAQDTFDFPGGGLIIRFSDPSASYLVDDTCDQVLVNAESSDPSGFFVQVAFTDGDGVSPWTGQQMSDFIGGFEVTDLTPPETTITKGPKKRTEKHKAKLKFASDEAGSFECKLDKRRFKPCDSPKKYKRLDDGKHKVKVRAADEADNTDPTPAKRKWKVLD
jgi:hypothetical protein